MNLWRIIVDHFLEMCSTFRAGKKKTECVDELKMEELSTRRRSIRISSRNSVEQRPCPSSQLRFFNRIKLVDRFG